ncbi:MAG: hypothetical protein NTV77_01280 [Candidatus Azambacteria bacterium]|nr:hypothetical protein [Candidatus Azambacteria bacterium]
MKKILFLSALFAVLAIVPVLAYGATFKTSQNYYLNSGETINDNLYVAGSDVNIAGATGGDLFVAGGNVIVSGPVSADLTAAGGTLNVSGDVTGDMRLAGGNVIIASNAGGELLAAGGQITLMPGSVIGKDVKIAGGSINYEGNAGGGAVIRGNKVYINGAVGKDLSVRAREITLGPKALIGGRFDYYSPKEATIEPGAAVRGAVNFHKTEIPAKGPIRAGIIFGIFTLALLVKTLMFITASLAVLYLARTHVKSIIREASFNFWKEAGRGFILFVVAPVAIIISFVTVIGITLGVIELFVYLAFIAIAAVIAVLLFAQLALKYIFKKENYELNWWVVILAVLTLGLITLIPIVGWLSIFIIFLAALGGFANYVYKKLKE